ncbi:hypothetical protein A2356_02190 [Candidatus Nomurabacteria bacterium RIFOXYB1_FULL_39_16]|uniref:ABC transporter domain-containing protein n=1 Tax=Candidatus Nomurabacteria bacterium RIFOXYB1_FULL_39_16 TaxID=1801803 RepID=A0A1F6YTQ8_9BACT|nr:MAG: hypothetical protein A2356_02190 [Candidatus Nomurabacteria bacterium RIFOXYB1_FULL_39_16]
MTPIIEVKGLSKKYKIGEAQPYLTLRDTLAGLFTHPFQKIKEGLQKDEFWALKDINFTVEPGEVVGIIGRNGAGKSTLLKILSRITPPTSGEVILRGRVGSLLEVGTGFQQELTGRENIFLNGAILGMSQSEIKKKFNEIVDFAEIEKFINTPVKHYSSGMYMRLAFSIAAHLDPDILIVDEVLAVGDIEFQEKCIGKMDQIAKKEGKTVLFVSHNLDAIRKLCHRCIFVNQGELVFDGQVSEALDKYHNLHESIDLESEGGISKLGRRGSGTIKFTSISILNSQGKKSNFFNLNDKIRFKIKYSILNTVQGLNLIIYFYSTKAEKVVLSEIRQEINPDKIKKGSKGEFIIDVSLTNILPGEYNLQFWLGDRAALKQNHPIHYDYIDKLYRPIMIHDPENTDLGSGIILFPAKIIKNNKDK